jgi:hypothetical protein
VAVIWVNNETRVIPHVRTLRESGPFAAIAMVLRDGVT